MTNDFFSVGIIITVLIVRFYVDYVVADIDVALPDVSGFLLEAVDVLFDVAGVLVFAFVIHFYAFRTLRDVASLLIVGGSVSADVADVLVDAVDRFVEGFAAVLRSPH